MNLATWFAVFEESALASTYPFILFQVITKYFFPFWVGM